MSAMQAMVTKMLADMMQNLPPEIQDKLDMMGNFTGRLDGRLKQIEDDLSLIKSHLGITNGKALINGHRGENDGTGKPYQGD